MKEEGKKNMFNTSHNSIFQVTKKYVLSSPPSADTIPSTDISSDPDVSSSGDFSYPSDGSNLSNNGAIKTDLDYGGVPNNSHQTPVNFSSSKLSDSWKYLVCSH